MRDIDLFEVALGLTWPWFVAHSAFCADASRLDIFLDFERGGKFSCPEEEQKARPELKNSRYVWLKNPAHLTVKQRAVFQRLNVKGQNLKTARAYQMKLTFQDLYNQPQPIAEIALKKWYFWATHSRLQPMIEAAHTIKNHWHGVLRWFHSGLSNGILEGINSLIQAAKARARGFRSLKNLITMVYLIAGNLQLRLPT